MREEAGFAEGSDSNWKREDKHSAFPLGPQPPQHRFHLEPHLWFS